MASGSIYGTTSNEFIESCIDWEATPINKDNKSEVVAKLYYRRTNSWSGTPTSGTGTFSLTIDGQSGSTTKSLTVPNGGDRVKAIEIKKTVDHNIDGTREITISASGSISAASLRSTNCSGTVTLDNIPRQATITSAPNFTDEDNPTINYSNLAGDSVDNLLACISFTGDTDDIAYREIPKTGTSYTFNLTDAERKVLRSATTGNSRKVKFYIRTVIGGTNFHAAVEKTLSIVNANPTFTAEQISYADTSSAKDITGNPLHIVQNQSNLSVTFTDATANKEATIVKYEITVNGTTKTATKGGTVDFGKLNTSSNTEIIVTVTDSRGNTTTAKKTVTVLAWALPVFTVSLERLNNYEDTTYLTVDASISSVNGKNTIRIWYEYAEKNGIYSQAIEVANKERNALTLDRNKSYDFNIVVEDAFDYSSNQYVLDKGKFPLFIDTQKNAVGINDFPAEGEALRVAEGVAHFQDGVKINGETVADYIIAQGTSGIWTYRKWASGIAECWGVHSQENVEIKTQWGEKLYESAGYEVDLPSGLFVGNTPQFNITLVGSGGILLQVYSLGSLTKTPHMCAVRPEGTTKVSILYTSITAYGRWK